LPFGTLNPWKNRIADGRRVKMEHTA